MKRKRVAIIGAGFSGVALAAHLARRPQAPDVVLIERGGRFGPGLAYSTQNDAHLLNVRAANMGGLADAPDDFAKWLKGNGGAHSFAPRAYYGLYVEELLRRAERNGRFGAGLKRVSGEAVACRANGAGWVTTLASGATLAADVVLLAVGHRPPAVLPAFEAGGAPLVEAWDAEAMQRLPPGDVLLLGTGLTMVDVALSLAAQGERTIFALSRRGLTPRAHLGAATPPPSEPLDLPLPLSEAVRAVRREIAAMARRGEPWQLAIDRLRADTPNLWRRLPVEAQRRFLRHLRPWWDVHRHRAAPEIAARIAALEDEGRLRVLAGEVAAAAPNGAGVAVEYRRRGSLARQRLDVAAVVNCTGGDLDLARAGEPLMTQLLNEGVTRPHPSGVGLDVDDDSRVIAAHGGTQPNLFAIGALTQGAFWECTAVPEIRARAAAIADLV